MALDVISACLTPTSPSPSTQSSSALHIPHRSKWLYNLPGRSSQLIHIQSQPAKSVYFLNSVQASPAPVSLPPAPPTRFGNPALTNQAKLQTLYTVTTGFPSQPASSQTARVDSCSSPNPQPFIGRGPEQVLGECLSEWSIYLLLEQSL